MKRFLALASMSVLLAPSAYAAPAIADYGRIAPLTGDETRPDPKLRYRTVFSVTAASPKRDTVNPSLDRVARYVNLLAREGIHPRPRDIVAIVSGSATSAIMGPALYAERYEGAANPNLPLIAELRKAGVTVAVCSQALAGQNVRHDQVAAGVRIDLSALTTLATLQLKGWVLIPD
jgi:intracellular sulfur oxidation DsrE/DsrF family protein